MNHYDFVDRFAVRAFFVLLGYILLCDVLHIKTDSVRDAWNVILIITGYSWGSSTRERRTTAAKSSAPVEVTATAEIKAE
jgi:hypothetical protein